MRLLGVNKYIKVLRSSVEEHHGDNEKVGSSNLPEATTQTWIEDDRNYCLCVAFSVGLFIPMTSWKE